MHSYGQDQEEFPYLLDWSSLDAQDLPTNRSTSVADGRAGGISMQVVEQNNGGIPSWIKLRQQNYISTYATVGCATPIEGSRLYYDRKWSSTTQTAKTFMISFLPPDTSLYTIAENPGGNMFTTRDPGWNTGSPARSGSPRGFSTRDAREPARFTWMICPTRITASNGATAYEPHGEQPQSTANNYGQDYPNLGGMHLFRRVITYADGHSVYDGQTTAHRTDPELIPY